MVEHTKNMKPEEIKPLGYRDLGMYTKSSNEFKLLVMESTVKNKSDMMFIDLNNDIAHVFVKYK